MLNFIEKVVTEICDGIETALFGEQYVLDRESEAEAEYKAYIAETAAKECEEGK